MPPSLRILHVIPSVAPCRGGPSKAVIEMVLALRQSGVDAEILTTNDNGAGKLNVITKQVTHYEGVPVRFFNRASPPIRALREFGYAFGFSRWLKDNIHHYDAVHVHAIFSYCSSRAMQIARQQKVPYIVRPIGQLEAWSLEQSKLRKHYYLKFLEQTNLENASCVHFTADSEQAQAEKVLTDLRSQVIPLGLNIPMQLRQAKQKIEKRWKLRHENPTLLFLSRLHRKKGIELLLRALSEPFDHPFQLIIAGEGDPQYVSELETLIDELGLQKQCQLVGFVQGTEKNLLLQGADLYVLTSYSENFGIAVLEAMASGTAVLVSQEVALSTQVAKSNSGYVCELDIDDIREHLINALSNTEHTQAMGNQARSFVKQNYQWTHIAHQLIGLYKHVTVPNELTAS